MNNINFSEIAKRYEKDSLVQNSAAEILIGLLRFNGNEDILDLGCGTGHLTRRIKGMTTGKVFGVDSSEGMVREARRKNEGLDILFETKKAEDLDYKNAFDIVFCNSSFMWFKDPGRVIQNCYRALRENGRIGIQAPAKRIYCPNFIQAIEKVKADSRTRDIFASFKNPWLFLETAEEYQSLFQKAGFSVLFSRIDEIRTSRMQEEASRIFESGAAAGYLNQEYYDVVIDEFYINSFRQIIRDTFNEQASNDGLVELIFNRIYLVAIKE